LLRAHSPPLPPLSRIRIRPHPPWAGINCNPPVCHRFRAPGQTEHPCGDYENLKWSASGVELVEVRSTATTCRTCGEGHSGLLLWPADLGISAPISKSAPQWMRSVRASTFFRKFPNSTCRPRRVREISSLFGVPSLPPLPVACCILRTSSDKFRFSISYVVRRCLAQSDLRLFRTIPQQIRTCQRNSEQI
jgi:hypothetical protein